VERTEIPYKRLGWFSGRFLGDVDGDGRDDLAMNHPEPDAEEADVPCFVLVYGGDGSPIVRNADLDRVRHTKFWSSYSTNCRTGQLTLVLRGTSTGTATPTSSSPTRSPGRA
jgi:hypothetical protein